MVEYIESGDVAVYNGLRYRLDKRTGYYLNAKTHERLHRAVYKAEVGEIPEGYHVHHVDGDKTNNTAENLVVLGSREHEVIHGALLTEVQRQAMRDNLIVNAVPKARCWHSTDEGFTFHSAHARESWEKRTEAEYVCGYCGKTFRTLNRYAPDQNRFCSNRCKAAFRRASGVDDIIKICEECGNEYVSNRYSARKYCEDCKGRCRGRRR